MKENDYCKCKNVKCVYSKLDEFGFWLVCNDCNKIIEDSFEYYNHYDGEDHINEW